jgi:DNA-binding CsgD family transcriptional regulator
LLLARGQDDAALEQLLDLGVLDTTFGAAAPAFLPWRSDAALILHRLGDQSGAARLAEEEVGLARQMGARRALGIALRVSGLVKPEPAVELIAEAVSVLERSPARLEHARALIDLGATIRRSGERASSRAPLREGYDLAVRCGATKLAERARVEISATGARASTRGLSGAESLTPSERRVAALAADGQSNRDIAQTLFITEKTVETHLGHVYDKLDVRSRHKLRGALG